jgi:hypothetical protein
MTDSPVPLDNATLDGLHTLRLPGLARGLAEQREHPDYDALGFEDASGSSSTVRSRAPQPPHGSD